MTKDLFYDGWGIKVPIEKVSVFIKENFSYDEIRKAFDDDGANDIYCDILYDILENIQGAEVPISMLEASWVCKVHQSIVDGVKDELPSLYKQQLIHEDAIKWLHDNHPEAYKGFYERVDSNNIE